MRASRDAAIPTNNGGTKMNASSNTKKNALRILMGMIAALALVIVFFVVYLVNMDTYNHTDRSVEPDSVSTEVTVDIHPRGQSTDSWEKDDAFEDKILYAKIYEATITNNSGTRLSDWTLRINISDDCYINNAWCGTVEIHQFIEGKENVQTLDLRDYTEDEVELYYIKGGQDLLIPLTKGDYIIYHPDEATGEYPITSAEGYSGEVNIGLIMYSFDEDTDLSDYVFDYHLQKLWYEGMGGFVFVIIFAAWIILMIFLIVLFRVSKGYKDMLYDEEKVLKDAVYLCLAMADGKDFRFQYHSLRTAEYAKRIAAQMGMDEKDCETVYNATRFHDVGNYYISDRIIGKPSALTKGEMELVKSHTTRGAGLLKKVSSMPLVQEAALYHHERYDGTGYPKGISGDDIPIIARIITAADAFDSMSHDRPYRDRLSMPEIKGEFTKNSGTQFDPAVVDAVLNIIDDLDQEVDI